MTQKEFASLGGRARAKALSKARRSEIARLAGQASALKRTLSQRKENGRERIDDSKPA